MPAGQLLFEEGFDLFKGLNFKKIDKERGRQMVEAAATVGFRVAVGYCFYKGWGGRAQDDDKAFEVFSAAAEQGYTRAVVCLGHCYKNGQGVEKNPSEAVKLYTQAADKGYARKPGSQPCSERLARWCAWWLCAR